MILNDPLKHRRIAFPVPRPFRVDDGYRSTLANPEAVRFRPEDAATIREAELRETPFEKAPRRKSALFVTTLRLRLIAAQEDVPRRAV